MKVNSEKVNTLVEYVKNPVLLFLVFSLFVIGALVYFAFSLTTAKTSVANINAIQEEGDKQIVTVMAKNGFNPSVIALKSDKKTVLKVSTQNTIDCSNTLVISQLNLRKELPTTGQIEIEIPPQKAGSKLTATCSMGHYNLDLSFL